jgi:hypothetical protein
MNWAFLKFKVRTGLYGLTHYNCVKCHQPKGLNLHRHCYQCQLSNLAEALDTELSDLLGYCEVRTFGADGRRLGCFEVAGFRNPAFNPEWPVPPHPKQGWELYDHAEWLCEGHHAEVMKLFEEITNPSAVRH